MPDEMSVDFFLDLLGQSGLVSDSQLLALMAEFCGPGPALSSANEVANELTQRKLLTVWQAHMLLQGKHRGFRLGPYRILSPLGQGGMSKVFLAEHEMMHRRCAIKILPGKYQHDTDLLNRFHLEAVAIARLDHPNIVRAYDFNKDLRYGKSIHYLVMEYVEGPDLQRMVEEQGPLDARKAADFISQAATGLAHAHTAGFVHRDIKPANLLVDPQGVLKILDLGLATFAFEAGQPGNPVEDGQSTVGTADYVAPEQVMDSRNVDGRADIYGLGLTFYYLLTGRQPFSKTTIMELLLAHRSEQPEPISKFRPDVPHELEKIIAKMIAKSPAQRYQTAKEVAEKLRGWLSESGTVHSYSRISALMAEAARAKQPAAGETTPAKPERKGNTDLQLSLFDEGTATAPDATGVEATEIDAAKSGAPAMDAADKDRQPVVKEHGMPGAPKQSAITAPGQVARPRPPGSRRPVLSENQRTGSLPWLLADDVMPSLPPAGAVPSAASPSRLKQRLRRLKKDLRSGKLLKSPWPWVGLAVFVVVGMGWFWLMPAGSSSKTQVVPSIPQMPGVLQTLPSPLPQKPGLQPDEPPEKEATVTESPPPSEKATPTGKPEGLPAKAATNHAAALPAPPKNEIKPPEPAKPPMPGPDETKPPAPPAPPTSTATERERLLAGIKQMAFRFQWSDPDPNNKVNQAVMYRAQGVARRLNIAVVANDTTTMEIVVRPIANNNRFAVMLSAELKCLDTAGKVVTVWKRNESIYSGHLKALDLAKVMKQLRQVASTRAAEFFDQFANDVTAAKAKVGAK